MPAEGCTLTLYQLVGSWELLDHYASPPHREDNRAYPLGSCPKGIMVFGPDGYVSATMITSGSGTSVASPNQVQSETDPVFIGSQYIAYTSRYNLKATEKGVVLNLHVLLANVPEMAGSEQQRFLRITKDVRGTILSLSLVQPMQYAGEDMIITVRWKRLADVSPSKS